ncbi:MAG: hypothetical protein IPO08_19445 [Xanthomonadales bacterium]|nr:hypothetical protein [Xanthomonadales bacterium]
MVRILCTLAFLLISLNASAARELFNGYTGAWWNPQRDGEGLLIHELKGEILFAAWFTYSESGNGDQLYLTGASQIDDEDLEVAFFQTRGAKFVRIFSAGMSLTAHGEPPD